MDKKEKIKYIVIISVLFCALLGYLIFSWDESIKIVGLGESKRDNEKSEEIEEVVDNDEIEEADNDSNSLGSILGSAFGIYSATTDVGENAANQMDKTLANMTNSTLRTYEGTRVRGSYVNELKGYIAMLEANKTLPKNITYESGKGTIGKNDTITSTSFYSVEFSDTDKDGFYDKVKITENKE